MPDPAPSSPPTDTRMRKLLDTAIPIRVESEPDAGPDAQLDPEPELDIRSTETRFNQKSSDTVAGSKAGSKAGSMIRSFDSRVPQEQSWKRPTNKTGTGATHVKTFYCKLRPDAIEHLDAQINRWLDAHPDFEVKQITSSVGKLVGKRIEDALFLNVWV